MYTAKWNSHTYIYSFLEFFSLIGYYRVLPALPYSRLLLVIYFIYSSAYMVVFPGKEPACQCKEMKKTKIQSLGWEDPLEREMATYSSILA